MHKISYPACVLSSLTCLLCIIELGPDVYAILKGKVVEFTMTSREVTLGRSSATAKVDFDLSMEGPAFKISRRQVRIAAVG